MGFLINVLVVYYLLINAATFTAYGVDKRKAIKNRWRIPEATLIGMAFLGGFIGAPLGMLAFHHKTRKLKFRILIPVAVILHIILIIFIIVTVH